MARARRASPRAVAAVALRRSASAMGVLSALRRGFGASRPAAPLPPAPPFPQASPQRTASNAGGRGRSWGLRLPRANVALGQRRPRLHLRPSARACGRWLARTARGAPRTARPDTGVLHQPSAAPPPHGLEGAGKCRRGATAVDVGAARAAPRCKLQSKGASPRKEAEKAIA